MTRVRGHEGKSYIDKLYLTKKAAKILHPYGEIFHLPSTIDVTKMHSDHDMVVVSFHPWVNPPARTVSGKGWNKTDIGTFKHLMEQSFHTIPSVNIDEYLQSLGTTMIEGAKLMNHEKRLSFKYLPTCSPWNKRIGRLARLAYRNPKIFFPNGKSRVFDAQVAHDECDPPSCDCLAHASQQSVGSGSY